MTRLNQLAALVNVLEHDSVPTNHSLLLRSSATTRNDRNDLPRGYRDTKKDSFHLRKAYPTVHTHSVRKAFVSEVDHTPVKAPFDTDEFD